MVLLYKKTVFGFLPFPTCKILEFIKNLSMLQTAFMFGMQSYKKLEIVYWMKN